MEVAMIIMGIVSAIAGITSTAVSSASKKNAQLAQQQQQNLAEDLWNKNQFWAGQKEVSMGLREAENRDIEKGLLRVCCMKCQTVIKYQ